MNVFCGIQILILSLANSKSQLKTFTLSNISIADREAYLVGLPLFELVIRLNVASAIATRKILISIS